MQNPAYSSKALPQSEAPLETTLLDLVAAVADHAENERELVAVVRNLLLTGQVRLRGCFLDDDVRGD